MEFFGRDYELERIQGCVDRKDSNLVVIYGRRRIGKTRLVLECFKKKNLMVFEGLEGGDTRTQKKHFIETLCNISGRSFDHLNEQSTWSQILIELSEYAGRKKVAVLFDEFQWLAANRRSLVSHLKYVWDNYFSRKNKITLIVCGSISSFIYKKVLRSKALYGRIDLEMKLQPIAADDFIKARKPPNRSVLELVEFYLVVGGVPQYLNLYDSSKSVRLNLESLICHPTSFFLSEYDKVFIGHFGKNQTYRMIIELLAKKSSLTKQQIESHLTLTSGGRTSSYLENLELAGFVESIEPIGTSGATKLQRFRLADNYLKFYFRFIRPKLNLIKKSKGQLSLNQLISEQQYAIWRGLSLEYFCYQHHYLIAKALGFSAVRYDVGPYYRRQDLISGTQVDLLFKRADDVITLCEIKWAKNLNEKTLVGDLEKKMARLGSLKYHHIEPVLLSALPLAKNFNRDGFFTNVMQLEQLFASV